MSKLDKKERGQDEEKQRPIQNFPDYLKYVAKKSKAGFDKVHEELYRIYFDSFTKPEKSVQQYSGEDEQKPDISKSKIGLRKRWSTSFWSSSDNKYVGNSFISYIPEEKDDLGSSTSSTDRSFGVLSDEYDQIKQENKALHKDGTCSATVLEKDKKMFVFDSFRFMPHSELTKEVIYTNDRVLHVETLTRLNKSHEVEEDPSALYSIPKFKRQNSYEIDDYINLRTPCKENQGNAPAEAETGRQIQVESTKDFRAVDTPDSNGSYNKRSTRLPPLKGDYTDTGGDGVSDEYDYLPPSQWTESTYENNSNNHCANILVLAAQKHKKITDEPSEMTERRNLNVGEKTEIKDKERNVHEAEDYYVPVSKWLDRDYQNVPNKKKRPVLYECKADKNTTLLSDINFKQQGTGTQTEENNGEIRDLDHYEESDYDRPTEWIQTGNERTRPTEPDNNDLLTEDLYTKVVRRVDRDLSDGDYSVPAWTRPIKEKNSSVYQQSVPNISKLNTNGDRNKTGTFYMDAESNYINGDTEFYSYTVDEVAECLDRCALGQLAKLCQQEQLDGEYFRGLTADDLKHEPYFMNWFHISKLFKIINGWRPRMTSLAFKR